MVDEASDLDLLAAFQAGDRNAGNRLLERHFDTVYRFFSNKVTDSVEDLVQETFAACIAARPQLGEDGNFRAYLLVAARSKLYTWLERRGREARRIDWGTVSCADLAPSPSSAAAHDERRSRVLAALRQLPVDLQMALELFYFEDISGSELATIVGVPEGTVRTRLRRARALLREQLEATGAADELDKLDGKGAGEVAAAISPPRR